MEEAPEPVADIAPSEAAPEFVTPSGRPIATTAVNDDSEALAARAAAARQAVLVEDTMQEARRCFAQQNYDCAEANAKTAVRLDGGAKEARSMLRRIEQLRADAMNSDWDAR